MDVNVLGAEDLSGRHPAIHKRHCQLEALRQIRRLAPRPVQKPASKMKTIAIALFASTLAKAQLLPVPNNLTVIQSEHNSNITLSYKEVRILSLSTYQFFLLTL